MYYSLATIPKWLKQSVSGVVKSKSLGSIYHYLSITPMLVNSLTDLFFNKLPCFSPGADARVSILNEGRHLRGEIDTKPGLSSPGVASQAPPLCRGRQSAPGTAPSSPRHAPQPISPNKLPTNASTGFQIPSLPASSSSCHISAEESIPPLQ